MSKDLIVDLTAAIAVFGLFFAAPQLERYATRLWNSLRRKDLIQKPSPRVD